MSLRKSFGVDKSVVEGGIWVEAAQTEDGKPMEFLVTFMSAAANPNYDKCITALTKSRRGRSIPDEVMRAVAMRAFAKTILKDWRNVVVETGGEPLVHTEDKAIWLMKELPTLYEYLLSQASDESLFRGSSDEGNEAAAKNSESFFGTNSNSEAPAPTTEKAEKGCSNDPYVEQV